MERDDTPIEGIAGASANASSQSQRRKQYAKDGRGRGGGARARSRGSQVTRPWRRGADGEVRAGARLAKHLEGHGIRLLHDRRIPAHDHANIDHLAVGADGVTVIDTKAHYGKISADRIPKRRRAIAACAR